MSLTKCFFWCSAACVLYAYLLYPMLLVAAKVVLRRPRVSRASSPKSVSIVLAVHNGAEAVGRRVFELSTAIETSGLRGELFVISDGSTDGTAALARASGGAKVTVIEVPSNIGKAAAMSVGCDNSSAEIIVFADVRQTWAVDALQNLLAGFENPEVGAVSGDLTLQSATGVVGGVGLYWRYEKWLRKLESDVCSVVGVTGAISAVRRELFPGIPRGTVLDDVYWPLCVAMQGFRVIHNENARAFDRLPDRVGDEFRRKVRTLSGNFQLLVRLPSVLLPWRNPIWLQFVSHKLLRLICPWALLVMFCTSAGLNSTLYRCAFMMQASIYAIGLIGLLPGLSSKSRVVSAVGSFLVLNAAAWLAFWVWCSGNTERSWKKLNYIREPPNRACADGTN
jgi:biofilm PGA synthesis N-glycosyltransferase PgaC